LKDEQPRCGEPSGRFLPLAGCIGLGLAIAIALTGLHSRSRKVTLTNGDVVRITKAPFLKSLVRETSCEIVYQPLHGTNETIILLQDADGEPAMIVPAADGNAFFCLYYADVCYRLIKIDPGKKSTPLTKTNYLGFIVLSSSCQVESATINDLDGLSKYLKSVPAETFNQQSLGFRRDTLTSGVDLQIWNLKYNTGYH
jgi:hypothetical protein